VTSYTIITTDPNEVAGAFHDRIMAILPPEDYEAWLSRETSPTHRPRRPTPCCDPMRAR